MTACAPLVSMPERISICCTPYGVAGRNAVLSPVTSLPTFTGWKPSTSFAGIDPAQHLLAVDVLGQRELDQDAVDLGIGVEPVHDRQQLGLGGRRPAGGS